MEAVVLFGVIIVIALLIRLGAGSQDNNRITHYIEEHGGRVLDITWKPFGPGWSTRSIIPIGRAIFAGPTAKPVVGQEYISPRTAS
jgi:hypothetical protein